MPPAKKEVKPEEPLFVDEEGSYVHEAEGAKYRGGVRRYTQLGGGDGGSVAAGGANTNNNNNIGTGGSGGGGSGNPRSSSPSPSTGGKNASGAATPPPSSAGNANNNNNNNVDGGAAGAAGGSTDGVVLFRHGRGTYTCPSFTYDGEWEEDAMHGSGQLTFTQSGNTYSGAFAHGCFSGHGTYHWGNGAVYTGQWRANRMHGDGVYTDAEGHQWKGKYYNGTGPGLIRLYPTLERMEGTTPAEDNAANAAV